MPNRVYRAQRTRAKILEDSVALEIFSPVREDYIKYMNPADVSRAP